MHMLRPFVVPKCSLLPLHFAHRLYIAPAQVVPAIFVPLELPTVGVGACADIGLAELTNEVYRRVSDCEY